MSPPRLRCLQPHWHYHSEGERGLYRLDVCVYISSRTAPPFIALSAFYMSRHKMISLPPSIMTVRHTPSPAPFPAARYARIYR